MQPSSKRALGIVVALIAVLIGYFALRRPPMSDQDQIAAQIESARVAAVNHNANGIMKFISADFHGPDQVSNVDSLHLYLAEALHDSGPIQIIMTLPNVTVHGNAATSTNQITIRSLETRQTDFDQPVTLEWRREEGRRFLLLPIKVWRVVGVQYQGGLPDMG
jgi:hypothetical protein